MAKRVVHPVEPTLKIHRYIVAYYVKLRCRRYKYLANRKELREFKKTLKPGTYLEVFKATHDFKEAWLVE